MPPFIYAPVTGQREWANNIAQLMEAQGAAQAQGVLGAGQAQAFGQLGAGQAYGNAIGQIGQTVGQLPAQIQQQKLRELQAQDVQGQIAERNAKATQLQIALKGQQVVDGIIQGSFDTDPTTGVATFNRSKFEQDLAQSGQGHLYPQYADMIDKLDASAAKRNAEGRKLLAGVLYGVQQADYSPQAVLSGAAYLKANGVVTNDHLQPILSQLNQPDQLKASIDGLASALPEYRELSEAEQTRKAGLAKTTAETAKATAEAAHTAAETAGTLPTTPAQLETARHNQAMERIQALQVNRESAANAETVRHNKALEAIQNPLTVLQGVAGGGAGPTGTQGQSPIAQLHGPDLLSTLNPSIANQVKAYAEGRLQFPGGRAMTAPYYQGMLQLVNQYDPSFDQTNFNARNKARTDLESPNGTGGKTINAMNTALQHAGRLSDLIETLGNTEYPLANAVENPIRTALGSTKVTNFNVVAPQLMKEIERAWRGAGGSDRDIQELESSLSKNAGKQQQREALGQFVELLKGKLDSTQQQRDNALGPLASPQVPILFPQNQPIIDRITQRAGGANAPKVGDRRMINGQLGEWDGQGWKAVPQ